jgi:osmoprotectant transport system ATP-binding protein
MDEPFGALDPGTREALQDEYKALHARLGKTVVIVTHDIAEAGRLADDIVLLDRGRIVQEGSLRELLLRPAGPAVRAFLGSRAQWLALEIVRLGEIAGELPAEPPSADSLRLSGALPLGQALVALANMGDAATVTVDGEQGQTCSVKALRTRILSDVKSADEKSGGKYEDFRRATGPP